MCKHLLIDGENFVHSIVRVLKGDGAIKSRKSLKRFDLLFALESVCSEGKLPKDTLYYATRVRTPKTNSSLFKNVDEMRRWNSYWMPYIANQGVKIVKAGILKVVDSKRCRNCRHKTEVLTEKGVDVRLGVDVVSLAGKDEVIYLLSSDSDLIPAVVNARKQGAKLIYVAFEDAVNHALRKSSDETIIINNQLIVEAFKRTNNDEA
jgi:hypothetical protein